VEFVREQVIRSVLHRHLVFALPKVLRPAFRYRQRLLHKLSLCAWKALSSFLREDTGGDALPAAIVFIQTAGEILNWHPHLAGSLAGAKSSSRYGWRTIRPILRDPTVPGLRPVILKILHHIGRRFDPLKLPGRSPPLLDHFCPDPFPDYGPQ
jgi:hypothetical protein